MLYLSLRMGVVEVYRKAAGFFRICDCFREVYQRVVNHVLLPLNLLDNILILSE